MTSEVVKGRLNTNNTRFDAIDVAKGIGMILVVFAHVNYTKPLLTWIYSFHMPLFFIISGLLYNKDKYSTFGYFLKRRLKTLICPYIFFYLINLIYFMLMDLLKNGATGFKLEKYISDFIQMFLSQGSAKVVSAPLWFVLCLFSVEIMYYFISKLKPALIITVTSILVTLGWILESGYLPFNNRILPWSLDSALFALGFYALGNLTGNMVKNVILKIKQSSFKVVILVSAFVLSIVISLVFAIINGKTSLGSKVLNNGLLLYLTGIIGSISILALSVLLEKHRFLSYIGRNSFCIMSIHYTIKATLLQIYALFGFEEYNKESLIETIIPFIIVLALSLLCTVLYNKFLKFVNFKKCKS